MSYGVCHHTGEVRCPNCDPYEARINMPPREFMSPNWFPLTRPQVPYSAPAAPPAAPVLPAHLGGIHGELQEIRDLLAEILSRLPPRPPAAAPALREYDRDEYAD